MASNNSLLSHRRGAGCLLLALLAAAGALRNSPVNAEEPDPFLPGPAVIAVRKHLAGIRHSLTVSADNKSVTGIYFGAASDGQRTIELKDLQALPHLPALRELDFDTGTGVTDEWLPVIAKCKNLSSLSIIDGKVTAAGIQVLAKLPLTYAAFSGCSKLDDEAMETIADWEKLQGLYLGKTAISDDGIHIIRGLVELQELRVTGTRPLTNISVLVLKTFKNLTYLDISHSQIDGDGQLELQTALPACIIEVP